MTGNAGIGIVGAAASRGLPLVAVALLTLALASCSNAPTPSDPPGPRECRGEGCVRWSGVRADHCEQFDPERPNRSYAVAPNLYPPVVPITIFYRVIQRNSGGMELPPGPELKYILTNRQSDLKFCHSVRLESFEIHTQIAQLVCATSRSLATDATSASCSAEERSGKKYEIDARVTPGLRMSLLRDDTLLAPNALFYEEDVDCTYACDGHAECILIQSADLSATLSNLISTWQPGQPLTKLELMRAVGDENDVCQRGPDVIGSDGTIRNAAEKECSVPIDFGGQHAKLVLGTSLVGEIAANEKGRIATFHSSNSMRLLLPGDASVYDGPVTKLAAPARQKFIDFRTPGMCYRVVPR